MAVYKDNATGTWRVVFRYTDFTGERKQTQKRGFQTKREAQAWEREQLLKQDSKLDMTFASFYEIYAEDKKARLKESTWESKSHMIEKKILPYSGKRKIADIEAKDVIAWQNELMKYRDEKGKPYSGDYLKRFMHSLPQSSTMRSTFTICLISWCMGTKTFAIFERIPQECISGSAYEWQTE
mgnify:CR=1 FL=1